MNNSNAGGVFDIELQDSESSGVAPLEQSDDDSIELDEVGSSSVYFFTEKNKIKYSSGLVNVFRVRAKPDDFFI